MAGPDGRDDTNEQPGIDVDSYDGHNNDGFHLDVTDGVRSPSYSHTKNLNNGSQMEEKKGFDNQLHIKRVSISMDVLDAKKNGNNLYQRSVSRESRLSTASSYTDPLKRTGRPFGSLINDAKFRYPLYWSDIKDGLNLQCLATLFFLFFAVLAPTITFGGILGDKTDRWLGATEMLLGSAIVGVLFALVGGQPLLIIAGTGKALVYEDSLYQVCKSTGLDFLAFRFWISIWTALFTVIVVATEATFLVRYFTRFTKDVFALLISLIFIVEAFLKVKKQFDLHPLQEYSVTETLETINMTPVNQTMSNITTSDNTTMMPIEEIFKKKAKLTNQPNTALLSFILTFGTFIIAYFLRRFKNSKFLGRSARRLLGDFGVPIAITIMLVVDILIHDTYTEKLDIPEGISPTSSEKRGWIINPMGQGKPLPVWAIFAAILPAMLFFILIFMEVLITSMIINKRERKLKKGPGYNIDMLFVGLCTTLSGILGVPFVSAAIIRSTSQTLALEVYKKGADGKQKLVEVKEQRLTSFFAHILLGVAIFLGPVLREIPFSVLVGVFLYMGVCALNGIEMFIRFGLIFMPRKHHPDVGYVKNVNMWKMHLYTLIQMVCLGALWAVKSTIAALSFPFVLILIAAFRSHVLKYIFTPEELRELDGDGLENLETESPDEYEDVYQRSHAPP